MAPIRRIVVDALQVASEFSGVGRQVLAIGGQLHGLPQPLELELRCAAETRPRLEGAFPTETRITTPLWRSRPRLLRILYQQLIAPARDRASTLLVSLGDQGPLWGRARLVLVVNDVRRLVEPATSGRIEGAYYRFVVPRAFRRAPTVITISQFSRDEIARTFERTDRVRVVAHHPPPRVNEPRRADGTFLLVVGALRPYKRAADVVDALAALQPDDRREVRFVGPTEGREDELLSRAHARGVEQHVRVVGWIGDDALDRSYAEALATVSPSTYEGYGLPVAESLAFATPTVASDIPPHREVGGDAVLYFPAGNSAALAAELRRVIRSSKLRAELSQAALTRSRELARVGPSWGELILEAAQ